jgi:hypothetical protein
MKQIKSIIQLEGISGNSILDFLINCDTEKYNQWWEGTHLDLYTIKKFPNNIGNIMYMDEYVGKYRLKFKGIVENYIPGKLLLWRFLFLGIKMPFWLSLEVEQIDNNNIKLIHTVYGGFKGIGKIFNIFIKKYFSDDFRKAMDEHAHEEFPKLKELLLKGNFKGDK